MPSTQHSTLIFSHNLCSFDPSCACFISLIDQVSLLEVCSPQTLRILSSISELTSFIVSISPISAHFFYRIWCPISLLPCSSISLFIFEVLLVRNPFENPDPEDYLSHPNIFYVQLAILSEMYLELGAHLIIFSVAVWTFWLLPVHLQFISWVYSTFSSSLRLSFLGKMLFLTIRRLL